MPGPCEKEDSLQNFSFCASSLGAPSELLVLGVEQDARLPAHARRRSVCIVQIPADRDGGAPLVRIVGPAGGRRGTRGWGLATSLPELPESELGPPPPSLPLALPAAPACSGSPSPVAGPRSSCAVSPIAVGQRDVAEKRLAQRKELQHFRAPQRDCHRAPIRREGTCIHR